MGEIQMTQAAQGSLIVLAGASGDLGGRIVHELLKRNVRVRALFRPGSAQAKQLELQAAGAEICEVDYEQTAELTQACKGADCVISALSGLHNVIVGTQTKLLEAAVKADVPRFMPSDFCIDYTRLEPGHNRNLDLRREFQQIIDQTPIQAVSVLNGMFADLLTGQAPVVLFPIQRILYWGEADQPLDFTTIQNTAEAAAAAALDSNPPRFVRIAGETLSIHQLQTVASQATGKPFGLLRAGSLKTLNRMIHLTQKFSSDSDEVFPPWQGMMYLRDMLSGEAKLSPLDNERYSEIRWVPVWEVLTESLSK